jgi:hypothetical protein
MKKLSPSQIVPGLLLWMDSMDRQREWPLRYIVILALVNDRVVYLWNGETHNNTMVTVVDQIEKRYWGAVE